MRSGLNINAIVEHLSDDGYAGLKNSESNCSCHCDSNNFINCGDASGCQPAYSKDCKLCENYIDNACAVCNEYCLEN